MTKLDPIAHDLLHALDNDRNAILGPLNDALGHLRMLGRHADGYGTSSDDEGGRGTAELTPTERAANIRYNIRRDIEEIRDTVHAFHSLNGDLLDLVRSAWGHEEQIAAKVSPSVCCEAQRGKEGAIEWGDPTCMRSADKAGMCQAHYTMWYRYRRRHGIDTSRDFAA